MDADRLLTLFGLAVPASRFVFLEADLGALARIPAKAFLAFRMDMLARLARATPKRRSRPWIRRHHPRLGMVAWKAIGARVAGAAGGDSEEPGQPRDGV